MSNNDKFKDCRALSENDFQKFCSGTLSPFVTLVKKHNELEMCFRGNDTYPCACIYYNNHGDTNVEFVKRYLSLIMACHHSYLYNNDYKELKQDFLFGKNQIAPDKCTRDRDRAVITTDMEEFESICDYVK